MTTFLCTPTLAFTIAPVAALLPNMLPPRTQRLAPVQVAELQARFDPSLGALRAGRVDGPASIEAHERAELSAAQQQSPTLAALRAGSEPTNHEWKWLAIGAGIVLLIVLL